LVLGQGEGGFSGVSLLDICLVVFCRVAVGRFQVFLEEGFFGVVPRVEGGRFAFGPWYVGEGIGRFVLCFPPEWFEGSDIDWGPEGLWGLFFIFFLFYVFLWFIWYLFSRFLIGFDF